MLVAVAATNAQTPTATLSHEGNVKCFYGADALKDAVDAATDGDDITLSSGVFNAITITKAVNIKGAGMVADTINNVEKTVVKKGSGTYDYFYVRKDNVNISGIYFTAQVNLDSTNIKLNKCTITDALYVKPNNSTRYTENYLYNCRCLRAVSLNNPGTKLNVVNSFIYDATTSSTSNSAISYYVVNSIIGSHAGSVNGPLAIYNSTFYNSIIFNTSTGTYYINGNLPSSNFVYYCVGKNGNGTIFDNVLGYDDGSGNYVPNNTNTVVSDLSTIFKTFNGENYNEYETFELTTTAANTYLGNDRTQVGMHGGSMPYDPFPSHPIITKLTVAEKSTPAGKLSVDVEVKPAQ